ncbi:MAG: diphthine synthase [Candidatus Aenigmarchaeota archaeon]|nr:diphthine synthase [Candidatus Aenigmarchaeota archaeon]
MLYLIGLGLNDEGDVTLKAVDAIKNSDRVYCEFFTNKWHGSLQKIEDLTGKKIKVIERTKVESDFLIAEARTKTVALLIPGDPLSATTHFQLLLDAKKEKIETKIIHASSIFTAIAETGLHLYKFGRATTLTYPEQGFNPDSPINVIKSNKENDLHTLVLLDVKQDQNKYMTINEALDILLSKGFDEKEKIIACCMLGGIAKIRYNAIKELKKEKMEDVPAVIIVPGILNFKEEEALELWKN